MHSQPQDDHVQESTWSVGDYALSIMISLHTGARWGHCYENAYPTFFAFPMLFDGPQGLFVEGWIVYADESRVVLMEHGWLMSGTRIVDPTIVLAVEIDQPVYYFPGVFRRRAELEALENEFFPAVRFSDYGDDGMKHAGYRAAYEAAQQKAKSLLTEGKTFVEVKATAIAPQDEETNEASGFGVIIIVPHQQDGGVPYGQSE